MNKVRILLLCFVYQINSMKNSLFEQKINYIKKNVKTIYNQYEILEKMVKLFLLEEKIFIEFEKSETKTFDATKNGITKKDPVLMLIYLFYKIDYFEEKEFIFKIEEIKKKIEFDNIEKNIKIEQAENMKIEQAKKKGNTISVTGDPNKFLYEQEENLKKILFKHGKK
jgi:hypothetical protein